MGLGSQIKSAFLGLTQGTTCTMYALDKFGIPVSPLGQVTDKGADSVPLDMVDSEQFDRNYTITEHALQDLSSASTNVYKNLDRFTITGTWVSIELFGFLGSVGSNIVGRQGKRKDLARLDQLYALAEAREPIMVVSPRHSMPLAWIESITDPWTPDLARNSSISITFVEARIVSPLTASSVLPDIEASLTGNNVATSAGNQSGTPIATQEIVPPPAPGAAPSITRELTGFTP